MKLIRRAQHFGLLFCFLALLLVEAWYVAWLRRLPALLAPEQLSTFSPFIALRPWVGRMALGGVALLVTILGSLVAFFRSKRGAGATIDAHRVVVIDGLMTAALWAIVAWVFFGLSK